MRSPAAPAPRPRPRKRGALAVVAVLVGYLLALGGTSVGQGWQLLAHLAHAHPASPLHAPEVYPEAPTAPLPAMTTLRPRPAHGHPHPHGPAHAHPSDGHRHDVRPPRTGRAVRASHEAPGGAHEHDGRLHTHDTPAPEPGLVLTVALDKHRLPSAPALPLRPPPQLLDFVRPDAAPWAVHHPVETPPPLARG